MTDADKMAVQRIKEILTAVGLGLRVEELAASVSPEEANALCAFLDVLMGKPCTCASLPFPHQRGKKCVPILGVA